VQPKFERPRRALPWEDVQRLLRAVETSTACGLRDHALLLMMSTYGLGAGEVIGLQLQDIDWSAGTLQMSRPKTGVNFVLPLLPSVAKVLARYLRNGRPPHTPPVIQRRHRNAMLLGIVTRRSRLQPSRGHMLLPKFHSHLHACSLSIEMPQACANQDPPTRLGFMER